MIASASGSGERLSGGDGERLTALCAVRRITSGRHVAIQPTVSGQNVTSPLWLRQREGRFCLSYVVSFLDRVNVGFAALEMNRDLGFSPAAYGFGAETEPRKYLSSYSLS
jgi:hypothetical protein